MKVARHLKTFNAFSYFAISNTKLLGEEGEHFLSIRPTPPKNEKNILCVYYVFQSFLSIFQNPVKRLGSG